MKLLTAVGPERMKFTQIDQELYDSFRENFPDFNIETVDEESMKNKEGKDFRGSKRDPLRLQHPEGVHSPPCPPSQGRYADLRQDPDWQDHHPGGRALRHHRERQGQDPGQGGHPPGPAEVDLRWQAARGRQDPLRLQHPEGVHSPPCPPS